MFKSGLASIEEKSKQGSDIIDIEESRIVISSSEPELIINLNYKYEDNDMLGILGVKLRKLNIPSVFIPNYTVGNAAISIKQYLQTEKSEHQGARRLLIPYNISGCHWVGIIIEFDNYNHISDIIYIDSLEDETYLEVVEYAIREASVVYPELRHQEIKVRRKWMQEDVVSCGPLTIENLLAAVNKDELLVMKSIVREELTRIRQNHIENYREYDSEFYQKQRNNINRVASFTQQQRWLSEAGTHFNKHELARITHIIKIIEDIGIVDVKAAICPREEEEHVVHLNRIRVTLLQIRSQIEERNQAAFSNLLVELFYIEPGEIFTLPNFNGCHFRLDYEALKLIAIGSSRFDLMEVDQFQKFLHGEIESDEIFAKMLQEKLWSEKINSKNLSIFEAFKKAAGFSTSILLTNTVGTAAGFANMIMLARVNEDTLAASSLISTMQGFVISTSCSVLCSIGTKISRTKEYDKIDPIFKKGLLTSVILTVPSITLVLVSGDILNMLGQKKEISSIVQSYFNAYSWGLPAYLLFNGAQQVALGTQNILPFSVSSAFYAGVTSGIGYLLIFGKLGAPALQAAGLGYASSISAWISLIGFGLYLKFSPRFKQFSLTPFSHRNIWGEFDVLKDLLKIGIPIGVQLGCEVLALPATSIMIGSLIGTRALSAYEIATQYIFLTLTPYYSINQACNILTGESIKEENVFNTRRLGNTCIILGFSLSGLALIAFTTMPKILMSPFINVEDPNNSDIVNMTRDLLIVGGVGQVFDSLRIISAGALQGGFKDTTVAMVVGILGTCVIAVPLGYALGLPAGLGVSGMYLARDIGIALGSVVLVHRWHKRITKLLSSSPNLEKAPSIKIDDGVSPSQGIVSVQESKQILFSDQSKKVSQIKLKEVAAEGGINTPLLEQRQDKSSKWRCNIL